MTENPSSPYAYELYTNLLKIRWKKNCASAGNRTRINCLEGSYAYHYTTDAVLNSKVNQNIFMLGWE
jgi:hypothetical protein